MRAPALLLPLVIGLVSLACGPTVDLAKALTLTEVVTGWHDAGVVEGKNKIVPAIAFKLKNGSEQALGSLQVNAIFRRVSEPDEWGSGFQKITGSDGLKPGASTDLIAINSQRGYTGEESRADMLKNRQFVDAKVEVFAKYGSSNWTKLGEYQITRQLEAR